MTTCPNCASTDVVGFMLAPRSEPLRFSHCRSCERRWWQQAELPTVLDLDDVLDRIGAPA